MAATTAERTLAAKVTELEAQLASQAADLQVVTKVLARLIVHVSPGTASASFRAIATLQAHVATDEEVTAIERICGG